MLNRLSEKITLFFIKRNSIEEESREIYNYCFEVLIATIINLLAIVVLAVILRLYIESLIFIVVFMITRNYSGGYHAKRHLSCFMSLMIIYGGMVGLLYLPVLVLKIIAIASLLISTLSFIILAPVQSVNKQLEKAHKKRLKKKLLVVVGLFVITASTLLIFNITVRFGFVITYVLASVSVLLYLGAINNYVSERQTKLYPQMQDSESKTT